MKYMLLIYLEDERDERGRARALLPASRRSWHRTCTPSGQFLSAIAAAPDARPRACALRDGKPLVTDGPFAETREQLGGYS